MEKFKLSLEQIEEKATELSKKLDCKVTPIVTTDRDGNQIVGYFQEPGYEIQIYAAELMSQPKKK